jgi:hypothetical protein
MLGIFDRFMNSPATTSDTADYILNQLQLYRAAIKANGLTGETDADKQQEEKKKIQELVEQLTTSFAGQTSFNNNNFEIQLIALVEESINALNVSIDRQTYRKEEELFKTNYKDQLINIAILFKNKDIPLEPAQLSTLGLKEEDLPPVEALPQPVPGENAHGGGSGEDQTLEVPPAQPAPAPAQPGPAAAPQAQGGVNGEKQNQEDPPAHGEGNPVVQALASDAPPTQPPAPAEDPQAQDERDPPSQPDPAAAPQAQGGGNGAGNGEEQNQDPPPAQPAPAAAPQAHSEGNGEEHSQDPQAQGAVNGGPDAPPASEEQPAQGEGNPPAHSGGNGEEQILVDPSAHGAVNGEEQSQDPDDKAKNELEYFDSKFVLLACVVGGSVVGTIDNPQRAMAYLKSATTWLCFVAEHLNRETITSIPGVVTDGIIQWSTNTALPAVQAVVTSKAFIGAACGAAIAMLYSYAYNRGLEEGEERGYHRRLENGIKQAKAGFAAAEEQRKNDETLSTGAQL